MSTTTTAATPTIDAHRIAHVRYADGDTHLRLQLDIHGDSKTFLRPVGESWRKLHSRMEICAAAAAARASGSSDAQNKPARGRARKKDRAAAALPQSLTALTLEPPPTQQQQQRNTPAKTAVRFFDATDHEIECTSLAIGDVLMRTARIEIGAATYNVLQNAPLVLALHILAPVLAGFPVVPVPETEFCDPDACTWQWTRVSPDGHESICNTTRRYTPSAADVGCYFRVECHAPSSEDAATADTSATAETAPVEAEPNRTPFAARQQLGATRAFAASDDSASAFRVMSYNVLYDGYTTTTTGRGPPQPVFPYVRTDAMREMYRMQLVLAEIRECNADVVCLQEMGEAACRTFFTPALEPLGYRVLYAGKTGSTLEGCAVFVRTDTFDVESESVLDLAAAVKQLPDAAAQALLTTYPDLARGFRKTPSVAQLLLLRSKRDPTRRLVLANTHLFFRDDAHMVRLLQTLAVVRAVDELQQSAGGDAQVGVLLCGDLNAFPESAAVHFLLNGRIDASHTHWQQTPQFRWKCDDSSKNARPASASRSSVAPGQLEHDLALASACGTPAFTNFAGSFTGTLDWVLYSHEQLHVAQVFPFFSTADVSAEVALPSSTFPSDHISLVCDLAWSRAGARTEEK